MRWATLGWASLSAIAFFGCVGGTETGNPPKPPHTGITVGVRTTNPELAGVTGEENCIVAVGEADVSFGGLDTLDGSTCSLAEPAENWETASGDAVSGFEASGFDAEGVCGVRVTLSAPAGENAIFVSGSREDDTEYEIFVPGPVTIDAIATSGTLSATSEDSLLFVFDVVQWYDMFVLGNIPVDPDGAIRLGPESSPELDAFIAGVQNSLDVFVDTNGNGVLDDVEIAAGPVATSRPD